MSTDLFYLHHPEVGWHDLPGTFREGSSPPVSLNLVRARGYTQVFNLADGLPDPVAPTLTGLWEEEDEARLRAAMAWWTWLVSGCDKKRRGEQPEELVQGGVLVWAPAGDEAEFANVSIILIPKHVHDPRVRPLGVFKEPQ